MEILKISENGTTADIRFDYPEVEEIVGVFLNLMEKRIKGASPARRAVIKVHWFWKLSRLLGEMKKIAYGS